MKGIIYDIKKLFKSLKQYKTEHKQPLWNLKKIITVIINTFKKTWILIILGVITLLVTYLCGLNNIFDEKLYFSLIIIFVFLMYIVINVVIITFQNVNHTYYKYLKIDHEVVKRTSRLGALVICIFFVLGIGLTQVWFVNNYINPHLEEFTDINENGDVIPVIGFSYYDEYGNFLYSGAEIEDVNVIRDDNEGLKLLEFFVKNKKVSVSHIKLTYQNKKITKIEKEVEYVNNDKGILTEYKNSDNVIYSLVVNYNKMKTTIDYEYNSNSFTQTQTTDYIILSNQQEQIIYSKFEEQEFIKETDGSTNKIILNKNNNDESIVLDDNSIVDLYNNNHIDFQINYRSLSERNLNSEEQINQVIDLMDNFNRKYSHEYDLEIYTNLDNKLIFNYNNYEKITVGNCDNRYITTVEHLNTDFGHDKITYLETEYEGNYKVSEYIYKYWWVYSSEDKRVREYKYTPIFKDGIIDRINMYENEQLVYRYLFDQKDYGFMVSHYSYIRDTNYKYTYFDGNNNLFTGGHISSFATPMYIIRDKELYRNALIKQKIPYLYLLED